MANRKELVTVRTTSGCLLVVSHKLNKDGYFRKRVMVDGVLRTLFWHRHIYEQAHGPIPPGYEVNHKCKVRHCCEISHLEMLKATEHRTKDNIGRHSDKKAHALSLWEKHNRAVTATAIAEWTGYSLSAVAKWIREAKQ